ADERAEGRDDRGVADRALAVRATRGRARLLLLRRPVPSVHRERGPPLPVRQRRVRPDRQRRPSPDGLARPFSPAEAGRQPGGRRRTDPASGRPALADAGPYRGGVRWFRLPGGERVAVRLPYMQEFGTSTEEARKSPGSMQGFAITSVLSQSPGGVV